MELFFYTFLFIFWTLFGSFGSVVIYRLRSNEGGIIDGRSHCPSCDTTLKALDLIPIFSWLIHKWKCAYCKKKVSWIYPILEVVSGSLFALIWYFLIDINLIFMWDTLEIIKLAFWLIIAFFTIVYTFYDILFLEIPESILAYGVWLTGLALFAQSLIPGFTIFPFLPGAYESIGIVWASGILTFAVISALYVIMTVGLDEKYDVLIFLGCLASIYLFWTITGVALWEIALLNGLIWALWIFTFFFLQILVSGGRWMWAWDLRIALLIGLPLWISFAAPGTMLTYLAGSFISIFIIIQSRIKHRWAAMDTQVPFGPFLAIWFFLTIFYQLEIQNFIEIYF